MLIKVLVVVLVAALLSNVEAGRNSNRQAARGQRGGGGGRRIKGVPRDAENINTWTRQVGTLLATEASYTLPNKQDQVYVISKDTRNLQPDYKTSLTLIDFEGGTPVLVLKVKKVKSCLILERPGVTKASILQQVAALNNTNLPATAPVQYYASEDPISASLHTTLNGKSVVSALCRKKPFRLLSRNPPAGQSDSSTTTTVLTTTLNEQLSLTVPKGGKAGKKPGKGRGGRGGNRRGGA